MTSPSTQPPPACFEQLLAQARAGCSEALGQLLQSQHKCLLCQAEGMLRGRLKAKGDACDIVQDTLVEAIRNWSTFHGHSEGEFVAWLKRILIHKVSNFRRRFLKCCKRQITREVSLDAGSRSGGSPDRVPDQEPSPLNMIVAQEESDTLAALVLGLKLVPGNSYGIVRLHLGHRFTFKEIGQWLEYSEEAARKQYGRAIRLLVEEGNKLLFRQSDATPNPRSIAFASSIE